MTMSDHTVTAFDDDLQMLVAKISEMGGIAESMVARSVSALITADKSLGQAVVAEDKLMDALQIEVTESINLRASTMKPVVLTPHMGEFVRMAEMDKQTFSNQALNAFSSSSNMMLSGVEYLKW